MRKYPNGHEVSKKAKSRPKAEITDNSTTYCAKCVNEQKGIEGFHSQYGTTYNPIPDNNKKSRKSPPKGIVITYAMCLLALTACDVYPKDKYSLEGLASAVVNYDCIGDFHNGLAVVYKGEHYGYIDKMGNEVIPCIYDFTEGYDVDFHEGLALVRKGDKFFFINREGKEAFPFNYETASVFSEGIAVVWKGGKCGYINKEGNEIIIPTDKFYGEDFSDGLAAVQKNGKYGYIDKKGNLVIPMQYEYHGENGDNLPNFSEGLAMLWKNNKCGYIDAKGNEVISCKYEVAYDFNEGVAVVHNGNGWGYIDKNGEEIIPCSFDAADSFSEGHAVVWKGGKSFFINKKGEKVFSGSYDAMLFCGFYGGLAQVKRGRDNESLIGFIDINGEEVIPCIYDNCSNFSEGLAVVKKDDIYGYVDKMGNSTFDFQNEEVIKQAHTETSSNPYVGKTYKGSGNIGGLYTEMAITFFNNNKCRCVSDWIQAYPEGKTLNGIYEIKDDHIIVHCDYDGIDYDYNFEVAENGRFIGFDNSDYSKMGTMWINLMTLELSNQEETVSISSDTEEIVKERLNTILSQLVGYNDADKELKLVNKFFTEKYKTYFNRECEKADKESYEHPRIWWQFSDDDPQDFNIKDFNLNSSNVAKAKVRLTSDLYIGDFDIVLRIENNIWLIDEIIEIETINNPNFDVS